MHINVSLCLSVPNRISELEVPGATAVCVYMRDEVGSFTLSFIPSLILVVFIFGIYACGLLQVSGEEALKRTTLRSLGLTGGSAILRSELTR